MSGEVGEPNGPREWPGASGGVVCPEVAQEGEDERGAELPLTRAGQRPGSSLYELGVVESVGDGAADVPHANVLAETCERLVVRRHVRNA
jgi:hypothetical protein